MLYESALVFGFVVLILAAAWSMSKAVQVVYKNKDDWPVAVAYLLICAFLALFGSGLFRLMPFP